MFHSSEANAPFRVQMWHTQGEKPSGVGIKLKNNGIFGGKITRCAGGKQKHSFL